MKVALVTLRFDAPGGVETNVREVARRLAERGEEVTVYASDLYDEEHWERRSDFAATVDGVPVRRFPVHRRLLPGLTLPLLTGLVSALAQDRPDVIHAHSHRYGHVLESAAVARARAIPLAVSTHYHPADRREPPSKRLLLRGQDHLFGWTAYREARALVVETRREKTLVGEFAPRDRLRVIPPGVDLAEWSRHPDEAPPDGLPGEFLLYAGRIASNKGLEGLLRALAAIPPPRRRPLVLMGRDWGLRAPLEELARSLGIRDDLRFLGHVPDRAQYRAVFRRARAFVLPSEWEAFGLVLLEAMAAGTPIVATAVGGVPEVLAGGAGVLVPYGDAGALAAAILGVLGDDARGRALVSAGRARVGELTWDRCVDRHRELYRSIGA